MLFSSFAYFLFSYCFVDWENVKGKNYLVCDQNWRRLCIFMVPLIILPFRSLSNESLSIGRRQNEPKCQNGPQQQQQLEKKRKKMNIGRQSKLWSFSFYSLSISFSHLSSLTSSSFITKKRKKYRIFLSPVQWWAPFHFVCSSHFSRIMLNVMFIIEYLSMYVVYAMRTQIEAGLSIGKSKKCIQREYIF